MMRCVECLFWIVIFNFRWWVRVVALCWMIVQVVACCWFLRWRVVVVLLLILTYLKNLFYICWRSFFNVLFLVFLFSISIQQFNFVDSPWSSSCNKCCKNSCHIFQINCATVLSLQQDTTREVELPESLNELQ